MIRVSINKGSRRLPLLLLWIAWIIHIWTCPGCLLNSNVNRTFKSPFCHTLSEPSLTFPNSLKTAKSGLVIVSTGCVCSNCWGSVPSCFADKEKLAIFPLFPSLRRRLIGSRFSWRNCRLTLQSFDIPSIS